MVYKLTACTEKFLVLKESLMGHSVAMMNENTGSIVETSVTIHFEIQNDNEIEVSLCIFCFTFQPQQPVYSLKVHMRDHMAQNIYNNSRTVDLNFHYRK